MAWLESLKQRPRSLRLAGIAIFLALILLIACLWPQRRVDVSIGSCVFRADVADSSREQYRGLSRRSTLGNDQGMLFLFKSPREQTFVMREMNFPLDIIFIRDSKVISLYRDLPPEGNDPKQSYHSGGLADTVLEIPAGRSQDCGVAVGSSISW